MSMTSKKKRLSRKTRSSTTSRSRNKPAQGIKRFLKSFTAAASLAFGIASCALNPQLRDQLPLDPLLSSLGLPSHEQTSPPLASSTGTQVQTQFSRCPQFFPGGEPPTVPARNGLRELCFTSFAVLHSGQTKTAVFVAQRLNRQMLRRGQDIERTDKFYAEGRLPQAERAEQGDYRGSGYSRGHMAPAADMHSPEAMAQSFSLANMVPQDQRHNGGAWSKIEQDTRDYVMRARGDVYIFTGPVYASKANRIGAGQVAVPSHLYKVVYDSTTGRSWVHWQANRAETQAGPPISYAEFVRRTELHLLPQYD